MLYDHRPLDVPLAVPLADPPSLGLKRTTDMCNNAGIISPVACKHVENDTSLSLTSLALLFLMLAVVSKLRGTSPLRKFTLKKGVSKG